MRRVTMATRDELVVAVRERYAKSGRSEKTRILDEFVAVIGFHRAPKCPTSQGRKAPPIRGDLARLSSIFYPFAVFVSFGTSDRSRMNVSVSGETCTHRHESPVSIK